jgi:O-antigen ligase
MKGILFTFALTYGGSLIALFDPYIGLLIYISFAIIKPDSMWGYMLPQWNYSRTLAIAMLLGWLFRGFGNWRFGRAWPTVAALLAYWIWSGVSATMVGNQALAWDFVEYLSKVVLPVLVGITTIDSAKKVRQLAWVMILSQGFVAYYFNDMYYNVSYLHGYEIIDTYGQMGRSANAIALVTNVGMAFFLGLTSAGWWRKALAFLIVALEINAVMISQSRGGVVALVVAALVAFVLIPKQPRHYLVFGLVVLAGVVLAGPGVIERFQKTYGEQQLEESAGSRTQLWRQAATEALHHPIFGLGPDQWPQVAPKYGWPLGKEAHSLWIQTAAELGFVGLFFLLFFYGSCVVRLWRFTRSSFSSPDPFFRDVACMVIAALTGFAISAQFVSLSRLEAPFYVTLLGAVALKLYSHSLPQGTPPGSGPNPSNPGDILSPSPAH